MQEQSNYSFNDQVEGLVGEDGDVADDEDVDPCQAQVDAIVTCLGGEEAIDQLDDDKYEVLLDILDYAYFVTLVYNETDSEGEPEGEAVDAYIDCEEITQEDCKVVTDDINSVGTCTTEITALFQCVDKEENGGCGKCQN